MTEVAAPRPVRFLLAFTACVLVLYAGYMALPVAALRDVLYPQLLGQPVAMLVNWLLPAEHLIAAGDRLLGPNTVLQIVRGCDGAGTLVLLLGAILAYPVRWRDRGLAALGAMLFVYLLNELRLVALYLAYAHGKETFTVLHVYVLPASVVVACALFFVVWIDNVKVPGQR